MNITLYSNVTKRPNSTKLPDPQNGNTFSGDLKDETSFMNPVIRFTPAIVLGVFSPNAYNYARIPYWDRYYYITDWKFVNGCWEASMSVDVLASFKDDIAATSAYVLRSAAASDGNITDGRYPIKTNTSIVNTVMAQSMDINHGCYIIGITNCSSSQNRIGCNQYYAMTETELSALLQFLYSGQIFQLSNIYDISEGLWKSIMNPMEYIKSCIWIPVQASTISPNPSSNISIGFWQNISGVTGRLLEGTVTSGIDIYELPTHPQISRGNYLKFSPYSKHTLFFPPYGEIPIITTYLNSGNYLAIQHTLDVINGQSNLRLSIQNTNVAVDYTRAKAFTERAGQEGIPIQLSQVNSGILNGIVSGATSIVSALTGNYAGAATGIIGAASDLMQSRNYSMGYNGSFIETYDYPLLISEFNLLADENLSEFGRPLCQVRTLGTLSGYIQCAEGDHAFNCTATEKENINKYLVSGFFYE